LVDFNARDGREADLHIRKLRPSPAMAVAVIALVFAMTGVGAAAILSNPLPLQNSAPPPAE
jgi:hypothetical protein